MKRQRGAIRAPAQFPRCCREARLITRGPKLNYRFPISSRRINRTCSTGDRPAIPKSPFKNFSISPDSDHRESTSARRSIAFWLRSRNFKRPVDRHGRSFPLKGWESSRGSVVVKLLTGEHQPLALVAPLRLLFLYLFIFGLYLSIFCLKIGRVINARTPRDDAWI